MSNGQPDPQGRDGRPAPPDFNASVPAVEDYSKFAPRPDSGKAGNATKVLASMLQTLFTGVHTIYHYDVQITPVVKTVNDKVVRNLAWKIWLEAVKNAPPAVRQCMDDAACDLVTNAYSPHRISAPAVNKVSLDR